MMRALLFCFVVELTASVTYLTPQAREGKENGERLLSVAI